MWEVLALRYATQRAPKSRWYHRYDLHGEPDAEVDLDYYVWVLRRPGHTVVVDTGFAGPPRKPFAFHRDPLEVLRRAGVDPAGVGTVILSHFHYDHIGNVDAFPAADIVAARAEYDFWTGPYGDRRPLSTGLDQPKLAWLGNAVRDGRARLIDGGDTGVEGVRGLELAGHTPGQLGLVVTTAGAPVVLASDAAHYYEEIEKDRPFSIFTDLVGLHRGYDTLRALRDDGAVLVPGHDPEVMRRFPPAGVDGADLGVRIS